MSCVALARGARHRPAVLMPSAARIARSATAERVSGFGTLRLRPAHGAALLLLFLIGCGVAQAQAEPGHPSVLATIWKWTPLLLGGFLFNLAISAVAMTVGTIAGMFLGFAQISLLPPVSKARGSRALFRHALAGAVSIACSAAFQSPVRCDYSDSDCSRQPSAWHGGWRMFLRSCARRAVDPPPQWSRCSLAVTRRQTMG